MRSLRSALATLTETRDSLRPPEAGPTPSRSLVAGTNALFRARETQRPDAILRDDWAGRFVEHHPLVQVLRGARFVLPPLRAELERLQVAHCTRHRTIDALVAEAIADGFRQVVIVGAGFDSRCWRIGGEGVKWFEVDLPATLVRKAALLGITSPAIWVMTDLNHEGLDLLPRVDFDASLPTCYVLEGLVHYLPAATLSRLVSALAPRARVLVSFIDPAMVPEASVVFTSLVKLVREAPRQTFTAEALAARFEGFRLTGHWTFQEQVAAFAPAARGRPVGVSQDVVRLER